MRRPIRTGAVAAVAAVVTALTGPGATAAGAPVAYPAPGTVPPVTTTTLEARYVATGRTVREALAVAGEAGEAGEERRAATLRALLGRDLLEFDPRGQGRVVEVVGDLAGADRIAVLVPGSHTTMDGFDGARGPGGGARALAREVRMVDPGVKVAVVAWLGYHPPQGLSYRSLTGGLAREGAAALRTTVAAVRAANPQAPVSLLCHSYGSVVCGYAAEGLPVSELALYGSPGVGLPTAAELGTAARVWAGRAAGDWIRFVPPVQVGGVGFGADPVSPGFGARLFPAGAGGHGDYHLPGGQSLRSLARIVLGGGRGPGSGDAQGWLSGGGQGWLSGDDQGPGSGRSPRPSGRPGWTVER